jgi:hypothetical protein
MQAASRPLTRSRRCEKNRDGLPTVHHPAAAVVAVNARDAQAASRWRASPGRSASHLPRRVRLEQRRLLVVRLKGGLDLGPTSNACGPMHGPSQAIVSLLSFAIASF